MLGHECLGTLKMSLIWSNQHYVALCVVSSRLTTSVALVHEEKPALQQAQGPGIPCMCNDAQLSSANTHALHYPPPCSTPGNW